ncbi:MAG: hypothetical protein ACE5HB_04550, partial [Terriglobia bacterium]
PSVPASNPAAAAVAPPPTPRVVDFVSEEDVRTALERSEKIFISPRTIVTPSARELGAAAGVLVETEATAAAARRADS